MNTQNQQKGAGNTTAALSFTPPHYCSPCDSRWPLGQVRYVGASRGYYSGGENYWTGHAWATNKAYAKRYTPVGAWFAALWLRLRFRGQFGPLFVLRSYNDGCGNYPLYRA